MPRKRSQKIKRPELLKDFYSSPDEALFGQITVAAVRDCSCSTLERERRDGTGIRFTKIGTSVRYKKSDVLTWLGQFGGRYESHNQKARIQSPHRG